jgi:hypothetical protein
MAILCRSATWRATWPDDTCRFRDIERGGQDDEDDGPIDYEVLVRHHTILKQVNVIAPGIRLEGEITLPFALSCGTEFTAPGVQPSRSLMRYERVALVRPPKLSK